MNDRRVFPRLLVLVAFYAVASCAGSPGDMTSTESQEESTRVWDTVEPLLIAAAPVVPALDISVELFAPGISAADRSPVAEVRRLES